MKRWIIAILLAAVLIALVFMVVNQTTPTFIELEPESAISDDPPEPFSAPEPEPAPHTDPDIPQD
jgi:hypothetical protein